MRHLVKLARKALGDEIVLFTTDPPRLSRREAYQMMRSSGEPIKLNKQRSQQTKPTKSINPTIRKGVCRGSCNHCMYSIIQFNQCRSNAWCWMIACCWTCSWITAWWNCDVESLHVAEHAVQSLHVEFYNAEWLHDQQHAVEMVTNKMIDDCICNVESLHVQQHAVGRLVHMSAVL